MVFKRYSSEESTNEHGSLFLGSLLVVALIGTALRAYALLVPARYDEAFTFLLYVRHPLNESLSNYSLPNNHLFHTLLAHVSTSLLGNDLWALRLPVFIAGILLIPLAYFCGKKLFNSPVGLVTAAMVAGSYHLVLYSADARGYILKTLFFLAALILAEEVRTEKGQKAWIYFSIVAALGFFTIPTFLFAYGGIILWLICCSIANDSPLGRAMFNIRVVLSLLLTALLTLLFYGPVIRRSGISSLTELVTPVPIRQYIGGIPSHFLDTWHYWNSQIPLPITILLIVGLCVYPLWHKREASFRVPLIIPLLLWPILLLFFLRTDPFPRVWVYFIPLYFALGSAGLLYLVAFAFRPLRTQSTTVAVIAALIALLSMGAASYRVVEARVTDPSDNAELISRSLMDILQPGDFVAASGKLEKRLQYYFFLQQKEFPIRKWDWKLQLLQMKEQRNETDTPFSFSRSRTFLVLVSDADLDNMKAKLNEYVPADARIRWVMRKQIGSSKVIEFIFE